MWLRLFRTHVGDSGPERDATSRRESAHDRHGKWVQEPDEIRRDAVDAGLVKLTHHAEAAEVELEGLGLHTPQAGHVVDDDRGEVGLPCDGAKTRELGRLDVQRTACARDVPERGGKSLEEVVLGLVREAVPSFAAAERLERRRDIRDVVQRGDGMSRLCALRHVGLFATPSGNHYTLDKSTFMNTFSKASGIRTDVL